MKTLIAAALFAISFSAAAQVSIPIGEWRGDSYTYSDVIPNGYFVEVTATSKAVAWHMLINCKDRTFAFISAAFDGGKPIFVEPYSADFYVIDNWPTLMNRLHQALCTAV